MKALLPLSWIFGAGVALRNRYYDRIEAPAKAWYVFEETSHFPHFEQPGQFTAAMVELKERWGHCEDSSSTTN